MKRNLDFGPETEQVKKARLDLSLAQVLGGALAAMTAAALGSRFGVEGTVVGAALASVIAALASALYTASLRRTGETVRVVLRSRPREAAGLERQVDSPPPAFGASAVSPDSLPRLAGAADSSPRSSRRRALVVRSVVGALATFALAAGALTMYEVLSGHALSGGSGTTFSQVQQNEREDRPTDEQAPAPSESADSSTAEPSDTPEAESSSTAQPSAEPSAEPSVTPEAEPSTTAAAPSAPPSQSDPSPR